MGTDSTENNLNKKLKLSKKFNLFKKLKLNHRHLKSTNSFAGSLSSSSSFNISNGYNRRNSSKNSNYVPIKIKLTFCGDCFCGKTALIFSYYRRKIPDKYLPTIVEQLDGNFF